KNTVYTVSKLNARKKTCKNMKNERLETTRKERLFQKIQFSKKQNNQNSELVGTDIEYIVGRSYIDCR
ncbi:MAG: hypothetical protein ACLT07_10745, partial [Clostridia bacterium]